MTDAVPATFTTDEAYGRELVARTAFERSWSLMPA